MNSLIADAVKKYDMLKSGDRVVVALSGGADSVSLLDNLNDIKELYNLTIYAAHVNHLLRGAEAERDENFCKILCEKYNVELFFNFTCVTLLIEKNSPEYSLVLSVAPDSESAEFIIVAQSALCNETLL